MNWIFIYSILPKLWRLFCWNFEIWAVQKYVHLVDLVKSFPTNIYLQNLASIQPRTSLSKLFTYPALDNSKLFHLIIQPWDLIFTEPPHPTHNKPLSFQFILIIAHIHSAAYISIFRLRHPPPPITPRQHHLSVLKIRSTSIIDTSYCYFGLVLAKRWNIDTAEKELSIFQMLVILAIFTN